MINAGLGSPGQHFPEGTDMRQTISCAIVVFNEERNIREALNSVAWMDEIIAVDSYSTDKTVEICREFTPHVFQRKWNGFGEQKNSAIDRATSDWVFILDADERVSDDLRAEIQRVLETSTPVGPVAYSLPRKNYYYGKWIRWGGVYPDYQLRLFRRGVGRLDDSEPHNRFVFEGLHGDLTHALDHYTERTIEDHFKKFNNFTTLAARERGKTKKRVRWSDLTIRPLFTFWKYYVRRQAFRDGVHGLIISVFASMYTFVKYAKLWDTTRQGTAHPDAK
jgi:(heptosyl)LPS beta-1,4-glucosyltransferase